VRLKAVRLNAVSLANGWVQTPADGPVRADRVIGTGAPTTAALRPDPEYL
jgi:hypothetical protein